MRYVQGAPYYAEYIEVSAPQGAIRNSNILGDIAEHTKHLLLRVEQRRRHEEAKAGQPLGLQIRNFSVTLTSDNKLRIEISNDMIPHDPEDGYCDDKGKFHLFGQE